MDNDLYISESEYERKSRRTAWIISVVFHLCALLPLAFITCSAPGSTEDLTQIVGWGGGGGNPDVDAPIGEAPKGNPDADGGSASSQEPQKTTQTTTQSAASDPKSPATDPANPSQTASSTSSTPTSTQTTSQGSNNSSSTQEGSGEAKGQPDGRGTKPAGGSGGSSVGVGDGNLGRCWEIRPSQAARRATTTEEGRVTVTAVVKWDGKVTAIRKVSGSTSLFSKARTLLSNAKACRADPGTPDVTITLTYNFNLN